MTRRRREVIRSPKSAVVPPGVVTAPEWAAAQAAIGRVDPGTTGADGQFATIGPAGIIWHRTPYNDLTHPRWGGSVQAALNDRGANGGGTVVGNPGTTYAQTTTLTVPANVTLSKVTLAFTGAPDSTMSAVRLNGIGATVEDCTITVAAGDYRRTISHRANGTISRRNTIAHTTTDIPAPNAMTAIYASTGATMTGVVIERNDITVANAPKANGVLTAMCPGAKVHHNHIHDFTNIPSAVALDWGIYISNDCPGASVEGNWLHNLPCSGIHHNTGSSGTVAADSGRRVIGNVVEDLRWIGIGLSYTNGAEAASNTVRRCDMLISDLGGDATRLHDNGLADVVVQPVPTSVDRPMVQCTSTNVEYHHNTIGVRGDAYYAFYMRGARPSLRGNKLLAGRPRHGIVLFAEAIRGEVEGGSIAASDDATGGSAVRLAAADSTCRGVRIEVTAAANHFGITIQGDRAQAALNNISGGATCIWVSGGTGAQVIDNVLAGWSSAPIATSGATSPIIHHTGAGAPTIVAGVGSTWRRSDGGDGTTLYLNVTGTSTWKAVA